LEIDLEKLLSQNNLLLTFLVIGSGYGIGKLRFGSIELGSTTGVLLAGLLFGHLGFPDTPGAAAFGFTLFIFSVGLQAGPRFFSVFLEDGPKYLALSAVVAATGITLAILLGRLLGLDFGMNAGLLAGALTSTPTLAGAQDAVRSGLAAVPQGLTPKQATTNVSIAYAITYLFGTAGLIVFIRYVPALLRVDLPAEARRLARERGLEGRSTQRARRLPVVRAYRVPEQAVGRRLREADQRVGPEVSVLKVRRGEEILDADPELELQDGDVLSVLVPHDVLQRRLADLGQEVLDPELIHYEITTKEIVLTSNEAAGRALGELRITEEYGCVPAGIVRASIELPADDSTVLNRGDRLRVTGESDRVKQLALRLGYVEAEAEQTDLFTFSFALVAGILLGMVLLKLGNVSIGLGSAGGLLLVGILIGYLRSVYPTFGGVPAPARFVLMELGLMLFMAEVGLKAGGGVVEALASVGPQLVLSGIVVTLVPVLVSYAFGRLVLKMNPALLLGSITGAMTSTPSLSIVTEAARSEVPALGYAGTYTFANVLLTFAGTILMML
jgi:putative transport protein